VAVGGTTNTIVKFTSSTTIGDTTTPIYESATGTIVIGSTTATAASVLLELVSSNEGFLFPRVTEASRIAMTGTPGLIVYQTDNDEGLYIYKSSVQWVQII